MHEGSFTCGQCEPGLVQFDSATTSQLDSVPASSSSAPVVSHKAQLKELKKRYGLQDNSKIDYTSKFKTFDNYNNLLSIRTEYETVKMDPKNDRAEHRRQKVGSSCEYEKTKTASLNTYVQ